MTLFVSALLIRGLRWGSATEGTLFTDGVLTASTLPAGVPGLSTSLNVVARLDGPPSGSEVSVDLRRPVPGAKSVTARLRDDAEGTAAILFSPDPGYANTRRYTLETVAGISPSATSLVATGPTAPAMDSYLYLQGQAAEAIKVAGVATAGNAHTLTVTRGQLGSHAKAVEIDPSAYPPGDDGLHEALIVTSRLPFGEALIEASLFQFRMKAEDPHAVEACEWAWHGHIRARPKPGRDNDGWYYDVEVSHATQAVVEHSYPGTKGIETSFCVTVVDRASVSDLLGEGGTSLAGVLYPLQVYADLSAYEAERLFNRRLRKPHGALDSTLVSTLNTRLTTDSVVQWDLYGEVGGHRWCWRISKVEYQSAAFFIPQARVRVHAALVAHSPGAGISDKPVNYPANSFALDGNFARQDNLNEGFVESGNPKVRIDLGEKPPKLSARPRFKTNFPEAVLYLLLSGQGGGANDATYDKITGGWGLGLDPAWVNTGSAGTPISDDEGTQEILKLAGILDETYDYGALPEKKLGDWLTPQLNGHTSLLSFVASTGKLCFRLWARQVVSRTVLNPIIDPDGEVETGDTLEALRYLILKRGPDPISLEFPPEATKPIQLPETRLRDTGSPLVVEIYKAGTAITDQEIASGPLARLLRAQFTVGQGEPECYKIPLSISSGIQVGDLVSWTDSSIPTALGRGVTALPLIVLGVSRNFQSGHLTAYCVRDVVNAEAEASASAGVVAPRLKIAGVWAVSGNVFTLVVESVAADTGFRIDLSHGEIWDNLFQENARVRVLNKRAHNPSSAVERVGALEASGTITDLGYDSAAKRSLLTISFDSAWSRGGKTLAADIVVKGAYILLSDAVPGHANPEGATIQPSAFQGFSGADFAKITAHSAARRPSFDGRRSLIGS